jgi:hypothetical protein
MTFFNRRGDITVLTCLVICVAFQGFLSLIGRGGFHDRSNASHVTVSGTNITVTIMQTLNPAGGAQLDIPLSKTQ